MDIIQLKNLINDLVKMPSECEWIEFKHNFLSPEEIDFRLKIKMLQ